MRLIDQLRDTAKSGMYEALKEKGPGIYKQSLLDNLEGLLDVARNPDLPVIDVSNVADYVAKDARRFARPPKEIIVCGVPPFSTCWMEFNSTEQPLSAMGHAGALIHTLDMRTHSTIDKIRLADEMKAHKSTRESFEDAAWLVLGAIFVMFDRSPTFPLPLGLSWFLLDKDGLPLSMLDGDMFFGLEEIERCTSGLKNPTALDNTTYAALISLLTPFLIMNVFSVSSSFMSCKNVRRIENQAPRYERRQRERENKLPLTKYYTLEIEPMKEILRTEGQIEKVGLKRALHICRGGFAYYTPEKPLFGKLTGRFWRPAHVRGSKEAGEIKKDYRIKMEKGKKKTAIDS